MFASKYSQTMAVLPEQVANGAKHSCKKIIDGVRQIQHGYVAASFDTSHNAPVV